MPEGDAGPVHSGVAWLRRDYEDDLVEFREVTAPARRHAADEVSRLLVPRLRAGESPHRALDGIPLAPWAMRLSRLALRARRTLGDADWRLEWDDDGGRCRARRVRRTGPPPWHETLARIEGLGPDWPQTPVLPILPGMFGAALVATAAQAAFTGWRRHLPALPHGRAPVVVRHGEAYLNVSLATDVLRRLGRDALWLLRPAEARDLLMTHTAADAELLDVRRRAGVRSTAAGAGWLAGSQPVHGPRHLHAAESGVEFVGLNEEKTWRSSS